jgi:large subunit ribosomal protein L10
LGKLAFKEAGREFPDDYFLGSTAVGFAFEDAPALAKVIVDFTKEKEMVKIKGGYLGDDAVSADQIKALAQLPPLPIVRAQFLSTLLAPANNLVRLLAEPSRQIAQVLQSRADSDAASVPA